VFERDIIEGKAQLGSSASGSKEEKHLEKELDPS